jgi:hypothetical protein
LFSFFFFFLAWKMSSGDDFIAYLARILITEADFKLLAPADRLFYRDAFDAETRRGAGSGVSIGSPDFPKIAGPEVEEISNFPPLEATCEPNIILAVDADTGGDVVAAVDSDKAEASVPVSPDVSVEKLELSPSHPAEPLLLWDYPEDEVPGVSVLLRS